MFLLHRIKPHCFLQEFKSIRTCTSFDSFSQVFQISCVICLTLRVLFSLESTFSLCFLLNLLSSVELALPISSHMSHVVCKRVYMKSGL